MENKTNLTKEIWEEILNAIYEHDDMVEVGRIYWVKSKLKKLNIEYNPDWDELILDVDIFDGE